MNQEQRAFFAEYCRIVRKYKLGIEERDIWQFRTETQLRVYLDSIAQTAFFPAHSAEEILALEQRRGAQNAKTQHQRKRNHG